MKKYKVPLLFTVALALAAFSAEGAPSGCNGGFCMDCVQGFKIDRLGNKTSVAQCCMATTNCKCFGIDEVLFIQEDRGWGCVITYGLCASSKDDENCGKSQGDPYT
jgi:hypothetical protein